MIMSKQSAYFNVPEISNKHEVKEIKNSLAKIRGVLSVSVNTEKDTVAVDYDDSGTDAEKLSRQMKHLGVDAKLFDQQSHIM